MISQRFLDPGSITGSRFHSIGPMGNTVLARMVDVVNVMRSPLYKWFLTKFTDTLRRLLGLPLKIEGVITNPTILIDKFLGLEFLSKLKEVLLSGEKIHLSLKKKIIFNLGERIKFRLSYFVDGAGKWRYIAIGD